MDPSDSSSRRAHRLLQVGIGLFLVAVLVGLAVPRFTVPRLALSAHLIGLLQGMFLVVMGLVWNRLKFSAIQSRLTFWLLIYQGIAAFFANLLAGAWGAGASIVPIAAGGAYGGAVQETVIVVALRSAGVALIVALVVILWGLRGTAEKTTD